LEPEFSVALLLPTAPYAPECVEGQFSEVRTAPVLR